MKLTRQNRFKRNRMQHFSIKNADYVEKDMLQFADVPKNRRSRISIFIGVLQRVFLTSLYSVVFFIFTIAFENFVIYALQQDAFFVQKISINNNVLVSDKEILTALDFNKQNMITLSLKDIKRKILKFRNISDVHISKKLPGDIIVEVFEQTPIFRMIIGGELIDSKGTVVELKNGYIKYKHLPIIKGINLNSKNRIDDLDMMKFNKIKDLLYNYTKYFYDEDFNLSHISCEKYFIELLTFSDIKIRIPYDYSYSNFKKLKYVINDLSKKDLSFKYLDLQFSDVVVKLK